MLSTTGFGGTTLNGKMFEAWESGLTTVITQIRGSMDRLMETTSCVLLTNVTAESGSVVLTLLATPLRINTCGLFMKPVPLIVNGCSFNDPMRGLGPTLIITGGGAQIAVAEIARKKNSSS